MQKKNRQVLLVKRPTGIPQAGDFEIAETGLPETGAGSFLVRNIYLSVDPAQRGWAAQEANYSNPVPLGEPMRALTIGRVVESDDPDIEAGELLYGWFGWQDYCLATRDQILRRIPRDDIPLSANASLLGINGLTAYLALTGLGRPREGETLLVSTAAGSVGSFAGQIGRIHGCRTLGLTGDASKVQRCMERYGYDRAWNYRETDIARLLADEGPIDIYYDNVGGSILDAAVRQMRLGGRIIQCGTASIASWDPAPQGPRPEREVLTRRLSWHGFVIFDHIARFPEAAAALSQWWREGRLTFDEDIESGIEAAPGAIAALYAGANSGKKLIQIAEA